MIKKGTEVLANGMPGEIERIVLATDEMPNDVYAYEVRLNNGTLVTVGESNVQEKALIVKNDCTPPLLDIQPEIDKPVYGKNALDRQRIKRKIQRWLFKFQNLPDLERTLIFETLAEKTASLEAH